MKPLPGIIGVLATILVAACSGVYSAAPPNVPEATVIQLCIGPINCDQGRFQIDDPGAVGNVLRAYRQLDSGWVTADNLAVTRGWFTTPTFRNTAVLLDASGRELQVLFFDTGLICSRQLDLTENERPDVYHKSPDALVEALRSAPRAPIEPARPLIADGP